MLRLRNGQAFLALCSGAALVALLGLAAAAAAEEAPASDADARMAALTERMTVEQRQAVAEFQAWIAKRGESRITGTLAEGHSVAKLGGEGLQAMMTRKNADGTFTTRCVESVEEYALFLLGDLDDANPVGVRRAAE